MRLGTSLVRFILSSATTSTSYISSPQLTASSLSFNKTPYAQILNHRNHIMHRLLSSEPARRSGGWGQAPPLSFKMLLVGLMTGAGVLAGSQAYTDTKMQKAMQTTQQVAGKASVGGGAFELVDTNNKPFTDKDLLGEFALLYFGFTFCPDICPEELEKIAAAVDMVEAQTGVKIQPVFISVDPERDTPAKVKEYVKEFHPRLLGLTGDLESIKRVSKLYRVYFSKTGESKTDYLVDHSIIHYLINPEGEFVTFYAKSYTADNLATSMSENVRQWKASHPDYHPTLKLT